ncbi:uncharacterized protein LOC126610372 [Malus sylvestris]|uniref:uncharacterized protein LOC126610372 n=1 Tax=Malus sylvestris TaxID=3752 RepID=UPI0021AC24FB|nr:uncharacterized protein LOC126610372 [Malus sylvestris]
MCKQGFWQISGDGYLQCYAVSMVNQEQAICKQCIKTFQYLKGSPGRGVLMKKNNHTQIVGYTNASWAGCKVDRKSTTGYWTFVGGNLVTWKSKKRNVTARFATNEMKTLLMFSPKVCCQIDFKKYYPSLARMTSSLQFYRES